MKCYSVLLKICTIFIMLLVINISLFTITNSQSFNIQLNERTNNENDSYITNPFNHPIILQFFANTIVSIEPTNTIINPGSTFLLQVYCQPGQPMKSFELSISYNATLIHANSVTRGNIFDGYSQFFQNGTIDNINGEITTINGVIIGTGNVTDPGYLAYITFTALQFTGTSPINLFNVTITNETSTIPLTLNNGTVLIEPIENQPVILEQETPSNNSNNIPVTQNIITITMDDPENQPITWTIEGTYVQNTGETQSTEGTKTAILLTPLPFDTTIRWYVNVTDGIDTTAHWYQFTTEQEEQPENLTVSASADKVIAAKGQNINFIGSATGGSPPYQWYWNFGDGASATTQNPTHTYTTTGTFNAILTVTDNNSNNASDTVTIQIFNPIIINGNGPYTSTVNETIEFLVTTSGGTPPYSFSWNFGDGISSTNQTENHSYTFPGLYTVILTVIDSIGLQGTYSTTATVYTDQLFIDANGPYEGIKDEMVQFNGSASNGVEPYTYLWDFGDGDNSSNQNPTHIYQTDGNFTVTFTVTDFLGTSSSTTTTATISKPPFITINIDGPYTGVINKPVLFSATVVDGKEPYIYLWTLGDGSTSSNATVSHIYTIPGRYDIQVHITDADGRAGTASSYAVIDQNYPPAKPTISGSFRGEAGKRYTFQFTTHDSDGDMVYYFVDWGDGTDSGWIGPYLSGKSVELSHIWRFEDSFTMRVKAKDVHDAESSWTTNSVVMPKTNTINYLVLFLEHLMQRYPILEPIFTLIFSIFLI